jgi:hypothetical protein
MFGKKQPIEAPVLEHEVLKALYSATLGVSKLGLTADSSIPIHKRDFKTGRLDYSVLVDMVNAPEKYSYEIMRAARQEDIYHYQNLMLTSEDISTKKYDFLEISKAIENLESDECIEEDEVENVLNMRHRPIHLTKKGALAYLNETYTAKFAKETLDEKVSKVALMNEQKMKTTSRFTGIIAIAALLILAVQLYQIYTEANKPAPKAVPVYVYKEIPKADTTAHQYIPVMKASMDSMKATIDSLLQVNKKMSHSVHRLVNQNQ